MSSERKCGIEQQYRTRALFLPEEKKFTRALYERAFPEDSAAYVDYYYREKCRDNIIFVREECSPRENESFVQGDSFVREDLFTRGDGTGETARLLSMAHLNPYLLSVCGLPVRTFMIAAVATEEERRREGHMRAALLACFDFLAERKIPFTYLLPVDESIYEPFGFETVCAFSPKTETESGLISASQYDIFCIRDLAARERLLEETELDKADGSSGSGLPEHPVIMAKVTCPESFDRMAGICFENNAARLAWLRGRKILLCDEV
ncbi:MAG: GNAT family N-acetyltransferase [Lachnospiraceae bacterium]|nr:GNAT family N-acetyltransferase [Lachnospiraceae bacterium]